MMVTVSQVSFLCSLEPGFSTSRRMCVEPALTKVFQKLDGGKKILFPFPTAAPLVSSDLTSLVADEGSQVRRLGCVVLGE